MSRTTVSTTQNAAQPDFALSKNPTRSSADDVTDTRTESDPPSEKGPTVTPAPSPSPANSLAMSAAASMTAMTARYSLQCAAAAASTSALAQKLVPNGRSIASAFATASSVLFAMAPAEIPSPDLAPISLSTSALRHAAGRHNPSSATGTSLPSMCHDSVKYPAPSVLTQVV